MKTVVAIMVFCCLLLQSVAQLGVIGYYELRKDYIARTLCENRDKPQMKCCGKCYLRKQLKKVDDQDPSSKHSVKTEKTEAVAYILPPVVSVPAPSVYPEAVPQYPARQHLYGRVLPFPVFHPPTSAPAIA